MFLTVWDLRFGLSLLRFVEAASGWCCGFGSGGFGNMIQGLVLCVRVFIMNCLLPFGGVASGIFVV